ncbi:MAG: hypothetical protein ACR2M5_10570 [Nakamurella sp.]
MGNFSKQDWGFSGKRHQYTTIDTADGLIKMPNAGVLGSAIGPAQEAASTAASN